MVKTNKYARKAFYVDAVRVNESNIEEVAEWCGGTVVADPNGKFIQVKVHRPLTERQTQAHIGDWVLYAGQGFKVYVPKAFDKAFERVRTLTKEQADEAGIKVPHEKSQRPVNPNAQKKGKKKRPTPKNMPQHLRTGNNVGDALREAQAKQKEEAIDLTRTDRALMDMTDGLTPKVDDVPPPKSAAELEADKLIAEVERLKAK